MDSVRYLCLDVLQVNWEEPLGACSDCAILLEIWPTGGLLQTSKAIAEGSVIAIASGRDSVHGTVNSCKGDAYGYVVEFALEEASTGWFPGGYQPPYLRPSDAA